MLRRAFPSRFFFFNDPATTEIYPLSLHDALPISSSPPLQEHWRELVYSVREHFLKWQAGTSGKLRSEEHTSELQSQSNIVCRLLLEKKATSELVFPTRAAAFTVAGFAPRRLAVSM